MINGIININKPQGWTSQDVCAKLRSRLHIKKIGHTGTLDPMATGVLPVCIGKATRIIEFYDKDRKSYHATMQLGMTSDTLDITGEILERMPNSDVDEKAVRAAFDAYTGEVSQLPPKYSALKVNGKRAYELAREGADFELKPRKVHIYDNEVTRLDLPAGIIEFNVTCSKGTYIRTMIDDIGRALGCGALMTALERTASGYFKIEDSIDIEELCAMSDAELMTHILKFRGSEEQITASVCRSNGTLNDTTAAGSQHAAGNQHAARNQHTTGNQHAARNQHAAGCQHAASNQHAAGSQHAVDNQHAAHNQHATGCQYVAGNQHAAGNRFADDTLEQLGIALLNDNRITAFTNGNTTSSGTFTINKPSEFNEYYRVYGTKKKTATSHTGSLRILSNGEPPSIYRTYHDSPYSDDSSHFENALIPDRHFLGIASIINGTLVPMKILKD